MQKLAMLTAVKYRNVQQSNTTTIHDNTNSSSSSSSSSSDRHVAVFGYNVSTHVATDKTRHYETDLHGNVNVLLGGAMLSGVIVVLVLICYCCHKNMKKYRPQEYSQCGRTELDVHSLEVFTMDSHVMCQELAATMAMTTTTATMTNHEEMTQAALPCPLTPGPPPAYESLIFDSENLPFSSKKKDDAESAVENDEAPQTDVTTNVINAKKQEEEEVDRRRARDEVDLPSYEAALKLEAEGYV